MLCASGIADACAGTTVTMNEIGWQAFVSEGVSSATFMITICLEMGGDQMTKNTVMGMNCLRCAVGNLGDNTWTLIAAAYHAAKQFGQEGIIKEYVDEYYPYVCTCSKDVEGIKESLQQAEDAGMDANPNKGMFKYCSEAAMGIKEETS